ncbi:MAG: protein GlmU, partial [Deltaproteobacteria bacterium]|nr:protein GlmU [Deltaproteobacteria bacterium]
MPSDAPPLIDRLLAKGVHIPVPYSVEIGPDIDLDRISGEDVTI